MKTLNFTFILLFVTTIVFAQSKTWYTDYVFASEAGTYTEISGGTVHLENDFDDEFTDAIDIGFTFQFDGVNYNQIGISANGNIWFHDGTIPGSGVSYKPISGDVTGGGYQHYANTGVIAAMGTDLRGTTEISTEISSILIGTSPSRVLIIQYKDVRRAHGTGGVADNFNFQIKLYESPNKIEFVYGECTTTWDGTNIIHHAQVGIRSLHDGAPGDYLNRTTTTDWAATTNGTNSENICELSSTVVLPTNGLTFVYSPPLANIDAGISSINIEKIMWKNTTFLPTVTIKNFGNNDLTEDIQVTLTIGDYESIKTYTEGLAFGETFELTFDEFTTETSDYIAEVSLSMSGDENSDNDEMNLNFYAGTIAYGYALSSLEMDLWYKPHKLLMEYPQTMEAIPDHITNDIDILSGAYANDNWYVFIVNSPTGTPHSFSTINFETGEVTDINESPTDIIVEMTYDYSTSTMYGYRLVDTKQTVLQLCTINLSDGSCTPVDETAGLSFQNGIGLLACNASGQLYTILGDGKLYELDKATSEITEVGPTGVTVFGDPQSMEFDHIDNKLFWAMCETTTAYTYEVNISTGTATQLGSIPGETELTALAIPNTPGGELPSVTTYNPPNNSTGVLLNDEVSATFTQDITINGTPNVTITYNSGANSVNVSNLSIHTDNRTLLITHDDFPEYNTEYTVTIPAGAVSSANGDNLEVSWIFTTEAENNVATIKNNQISIYPNPSTRTFTIQNFTTSQIQNLIITNITGKIIFNSQYSILNSQFSIKEKGIYFITIKTETDIYTKKLIIQ